MKNTEKDNIRSAMGTLPSSDVAINSKSKPEYLSCEASIVDTNRNPFRAIFSGATATWGDNEYQDKWLITTPENKLKVVIAALTGRTLPQALEHVLFVWRVKGVPRATFNKHTEIAKLGCTFFSVGCRDNNKLDTDFIIPNKFGEEQYNKQFADGFTPKLEAQTYEELSEYFKNSKELYAKMLDAEGGSWQSARAFLPLCYQHSYHFTQNLLSLVRMYPKISKDEDLKVLYNRFVDSIKLEQYNLFALAIEDNKALKEWEDFDQIYNVFLSNKERELLA